MSRAAVVIGTSADALVAAHHLAQGGYSVTVVRERPLPEDGALEAGWLPPSIADALGLRSHGLGVLTHDPWALARDGERALELATDVARTAESLRRFSPRDAERWPVFCARMHDYATLLQALYLEQPPDPMAEGARGLLEATRAAWRVRGLGASSMHDFLRLVPMSVADLLDEWFECDLLKGVLAAGAVANLCQGPRASGTAFAFLHHHVGSPAGVFRPPHTNAAAALAQRPGIELREGTVARIDIEAGRAVGVTLTDGAALAADAVVSGETPARTLLEFADAGWLDPEFVRAVKHVRSRGVAARIELTLDQPPQFTTLVAAPSVDYVERAYDDVKYGRLSSHPVVEATYVGRLTGERHRVDVRVQYVPFRPEGQEWDAAATAHLAQRALASLAEVAPRLQAAVVEQRVLTPGALGHRYGWPQGQPYQAELALDQVFWMRPVPALARYATPIAGLWLCGPAMHPGAGIAGVAGAHAAAAILHQRRRTR